jgi:methionyl-tRNA synthetase
LKWGELPAETAIGKVEAMFPRIDKGKIMGEINAETAGREQSSATPDADRGVHATEADAVPGSPVNAEAKPVPPQRGATEADAVTMPAASAQVNTGSAGAPPAETNASSQVDGLIEITDFTKIDLRVAEVLTAERVPKADKLLVLTVDVGEAKPRQILAGIAQYYEPETLVGRKIAIVANLKPRKLRGLESQGMLLAASVGEAGKPVIATFTEDVPNGARLK